MLRCAIQPERHAAGARRPRALGRPGMQALAPRASSSAAPHPWRHRLPARAAAGSRATPLPQGRGRPLPRPQQPPGPSREPRRAGAARAALRGPEDHNSHNAARAWRRGGGGWAGPPARAPAARVRGGVREPRPTAGQVRASGAGSSCFNRTGPGGSTLPHLFPSVSFPLPLLPVMDSTHTSEAPRTRGMKLQMEQPGRSAAPCSAWALPTGAVADLAPAHREAQSSQQRSVLSSSQDGKGRLSWAWGHRAARAQGSVGSEEQCMGVLGAWGGMPAHSPSVYVLEPTAFNPSMHPCHGLESSFLSRIHLSGLSQNPLALHPGLHCWWLRTHFLHPELLLPGSEPTPSFPGVPTSVT